MARRPYTGRTTSAFGPRLAPIKGASTFHQGVDGIGGYNTAPKGGRITAYGYVGGWGNRISFVDDDGTLHYLAHNAPGGLLGRVGTWYPEGTNLGIKGMTGTATGVHVHWETRPRGGAPIDPEQWLRSQGGTAGGGGTKIPTIDQDRQRRRREDSSMYVQHEKAKLYPGVYVVFTDANGKMRLRVAGKNEAAIAVAGGLVVPVEDTTLTNLGIEGGWTGGRVVMPLPKVDVNLEGITAPPAKITDAVIDTIAKASAKAVVTELKLPGN